MREPGKRLAPAQSGQDQDSKKQRRMERDNFLDCLADAVAEKIGRLPTKKRLFGLDEAAEYYGLSQESMRELIVQGKIKPVRLTRKVQFDIDDLNRLVDETKTSTL